MSTLIQLFKQTQQADPVEAELREELNRILGEFVVIHTSASDLSEPQCVNIVMKQLKDHVESYYGVQYHTTLTTEDETND